VNVDRPDCGAANCQNSNLYSQQFPPAPRSATRLLNCLGRTPHTRNILRGRRSMIAQKNATTASGKVLATVVG
jgi:hypothetical protein